ncbi:MAG: lysophospholipid acyltransferase family protein [Myxococcota bacterium]
MLLSRLTSLLRVGAALVFMAVAVAVFAALVLLALPSRGLRIRICNVFGHIVGRTCLFLAGASVPRGVAAQVGVTHPAIYISNHTSMLDIFVGIWLAPIGTVGVAKKEVVYYPFFGQLYAISGHILLDRSNRANAVEALADTARIIKKYGIGVWLWPEGTRSRDGRLLPFKKGFAHLAIATRLPIVPVVVTGGHTAMAKNSLVIRPTKLGIQALPAIPTDDWTLETLDEHIAQVYAAFDAALPDEQKARPVSDAKDRATGS